MSKKKKQFKGDSVMQNSQEDITSALNYGVEEEDDVVASTPVNDEVEQVQVEVVEEPVLVEEPVIPPTPAPTPLRPAKRPPAVGQDINMLNKYLDEHIRKYSEHQVRSFQDKNDVAISITLFGNIINFILRYPEMELFEKIITFFRKERGRILSPKTALRGIDGVNIQSQHRYSMFYSLMMDLTSKEGIKQKDINMTVLEKMFNHSAFVRLLTQYMSKQL
jgi:hypothetical protein